MLTAATDRHFRRPSIYTGQLQYVRPTHSVARRPCDCPPGRMDRYSGHLQPVTAYLLDADGETLGGGGVTSMNLQAGAQQLPQPSNNS